MSDSKAGGGDYDEEVVEEWKQTLEYAVRKLDKSPNFPGPRRKIHMVVDEMDQYLQGKSGSR